MRKYSLFELQAYLQRVIALNFQEPLWVTAEIFQAKENRGHVYLELIDKKDDSQEVRAQCQAVVWSKNLLKIRQKVGSVLEELLQEGIEVSLQVEVTYHPVYGLKLSVLQLDPSYTLGKMELLRQETILRLKKESLLNLNNRLTPSVVLQRIAVISSAGAAGYHDLVTHLYNNEFGYTFSLKLFGSAVQGRMMEEDILDSFRRIRHEEKAFDAVVIIRGGGSKLDLAGFDKYSISRAVAECAYPVLTGIGHETDTTVSDLVAFRSFKTPTAVAGYLIDHNLAFESRVEQQALLIYQKSAKTINKQREVLRLIEGLINQLLHKSITKQREILTALATGKKASVRKIISLERMKMLHLTEKIEILNPENILKKGYSMTFKDGEMVREANQLEISDKIITIFADGSVSSIVDSL